MLKLLSCLIKPLLECALPKKKIIENLWFVVCFQRTIIFFEIEIFTCINYNYIKFLGSLRGYLRKKGKEDSSWNLRLFVLSAGENSLAYFIRDQVGEFFRSV